MKALSALLTLVAALVFVLGLQAEGEKGTKVTKKGQLVCGKCKLMVCEKCTNVLEVKEGGKTVNYFLKDKGKKEKYHVCQPTKEVTATVTGTLVEKDGKKWILNPKVKTE
jgi:hypothetical protein